MVVHKVEIHYKHEGLIQLLQNAEQEKIETHQNTQTQGEQAFLRVEFRNCKVFFCYYGYYIDIQFFMIFMIFIVIYIRSSDFNSLWIFRYGYSNSCQLQDCIQLQSQTGWLYKHE